MTIATVKGRETISSLSSSVGFTSTEISPSKDHVDYVIIQAINGDIRFTVEGTTPSATLGLRLLQDSKVEVHGVQGISDFRCIDDGGTAKLECVFMGRP